jgi:hypothetical protein
VTISSKRPLAILIGANLPSWTGQHDDAFTPVLLPVYSKDVLHDLNLDGWLLTAYGVGAMAGTLIYAPASRRLLANRYLTFVGCFAAVAAVRVALSAGWPVVQQSTVVRDHLLDALDHAGLPTDEIALLGPRPPAGRMPLYQSMVLLQRVTPPYKAGGIEFVPQPGFPLGPQCELLLEIWEADDGLTANPLSPEGYLPPSRIARLASDVSAEMIKTMAAIAPE